MNAHVSFHNVDHSDALQKFIEEKSIKLARKIRKSENFSWVVDRDAKAFRPILKLKLVDGIKPVSAKSHNAFKAVNIVFDKAMKLIQKSHQKHS